MAAGLVTGAAAQAPTDELSALARLEPARSAMQVTETGLALTLGISQPVPWRARLLDNPPRLVVDFREVDWRGIEGVRREGVADLRAGIFRPGWSRLVAELRRPMVIERAGMSTDGPTTVEVVLRPASAQEFSAKASVPEPPGWTLPKPAAISGGNPSDDGRFIVVLDPGHGGIDPGAETEGLKEADLVLTFARELKDLLMRDGSIEVFLTREEDAFVPLETRITVSRAAAADVFVSLHADALAEGEAVGATVYTLSDEASDAAAQALAERHDRADLLAGVDLSEQDDMVARVLMDMARTETAPRADKLADALVTSINAAGLRMHRHPHQTAGFSVLKSPDTPSVLLELGFMSSEKDLERLQDTEWRSKMASAVRDALVAWARDDAARRGLK
ncbi:MAG: N-acetylmuramoyl-L-alanine amidase [Gemmobacter sp.]